MSLWVAVTVLCVWTVLVGSVASWVAWMVERRRTDRVIDTAWRVIRIMHHDATSRSEPLFVLQALGDISGPPDAPTGRLGANQGTIHDNGETT